MSVETEKMEILIVDDTLANVKILSETLKADYQIRSAISGRDAIALIFQKQPDLILLDIMMPGLDGYEVCRRLKSYVQTRHIPVIFISAMDDAADETKGFEMGAVDYITKPFKPAIVKARVRVHLELKRKQQQLEDMVNECRAAEDEIRHLNQILENQVTDRTEKLKSAQKEIIKKEYKSELADISTRTLHNVKNMLTSVKISSEAVNKGINFPLEGLTRTNRIIEENSQKEAPPHPQVENFIKYYHALEQSVKQYTDAAKSHVKRLLEKVEMIEQIITTQQEYGGGDQREEVEIKDMLDDALTMQSELIQKHGIRIVKDYHDVPQIFVQKAKFIHILINLIKNAVEAMTDAPQEDKELVLAADRADDMVCIKIIDKGYGIPQNNLDLLFTHGFTTKQNGHGFGLHSSSVYTREMGGTLWAESDGKGKGATFIIKFPIHWKDNHSHYAAAKKEDISPIQPNGDIL